MHFQRRQLLRTLSFAFGSSFILSRNQLGIVVQTATQPKVSPPPVGAAVHACMTLREIRSNCGNLSQSQPHHASRSRWFFVARGQR